MSFHNRNICMATLKFASRHLAELPMYGAYKYEVSSAHGYGREFFIHVRMCLCVRVRRSGSFFFCLICCYFFLFSPCNEIWRIKSDFYNVTGSYIGSHIKVKNDGGRKREQNKYYTNYSRLRHQNNTHSGKKLLSIKAQFFFLVVCSFYVVCYVRFFLLLLLLTEIVLKVPIILLH